ALMPKLAPPPLTLENAYTHPVLGGGLGPYSHAVLGDAGGLTQFGAHIEVLPPGSRSSFRHWHETEDEMVYMLAGEVVLIEDGETTLRAGDVACWPAGSPIGHCLENRSAAEARYLTIGTRNPDDVIHYPDHDLITHKQGSARRYTRADGTPLSPLPLSPRRPE
ncbi:MAG TPA: cupin domain-containing protein, partial [Paracoccaceae bacterium]